MRTRDWPDVDLGVLRAAALDACIVPVIVYTEDLRFLYINPAGRQLFALAEGEELDLNGFDLAADREEADAAMETLETTGCWRGSIRGRARDGRVLELVASSRVVVEGSERYVVCSVLDATDLVETRAEVASRQGELEVILGHLEQVVYRNWCRTESCPDHESFVSASIENLVGRSAAELMATRAMWLDLVHPEDRDTLRQALRGVAGNETAIVQYRVARTDGATYRWVEDHVIPQTDAAGRVVGAFGALRDVTERKAVEEERALLAGQVWQASREWEQTFDSIEEPVLILGSQGQILRLNRAALATLGADRFEQAIGRELWQCAAGELWPAVQQMVVRLREGGRVASRKIADGEKHWLVSVSPVPTRESGGADGTVVYLRDLTEIDRLEASLRQAERMAELGSLVAGVAHEVRNPLFGISAIVDALRSGAIEDDELPDSLDLLRNEVERLNRLASGLLEFGKPLAAPRGQHPMVSVVEEVLRECAAAAAQKRVVFLFVGLADLPPVTLDRRSFLTALRNLVENAIQHAPEESEIRLSGRLLGDGGVEVEVRDHGPGFPEEERERLTQPFFSRRAGGTGLGLSIAANVIRQHGGRLTLDNVPGGGCRVRVELPGGPPPAVVADGGGEVAQLGGPAR